MVGAIATFENAELNVRTWTVAGQAGIGHVLRIPDLPKALTVKVFLEGKNFLCLGTFAFNSGYVPGHKTIWALGGIEMHAAELAMF